MAHSEEVYVPVYESLHSLEDDKVLEGACAIEHETDQDFIDESQSSQRQFFSRANLNDLVGDIALSKES